MPRAGIAARRSGVARSRARTHGSQGHSHPSRANITSPAKIAPAASASDPNRSVTRVEFFNGATKLGEDTSAPYTLRWNIGAAGT
jgi:hypothetical protein